MLASSTLMTRARNANKGAARKQFFLTDVCTFDSRPFLHASSLSSTRAVCCGNEMEKNLAL